MIKLIFLFFLLALHHLTYAFIQNKENPVDYYTNNEKQIKELVKKLKIGKIVGITGISGIGKSEMTRQYVLKHGKEYEMIGGPGGKVRDFSQGVFSPLFIRAVEDELILK